MEGGMGLLSIILFFVALIGYEWFMEQVWRKRWIKSQEAKQVKTGKNLLISVQEYDYDDKEKIALGIVSGMDAAMRLMKNYYGEDLLAFHEENSDDPNIAFKYTLRIRNIVDNSIYSVLFFGEYFVVDDDA